MSGAGRMLAVLADHGVTAWVVDGVVHALEVGTVRRDTDVDGPFVSMDGTWVTDGVGFESYCHPVALPTIADMWAWLGY